MTSKERIDKIIYLRFKQHMRPSDVAKEVGVEKSYVTKIIKKDKRYFKERAKQMSANYIKHNKQAKELTYKDREEKRRSNARLNLQHMQATRELSYEVKTTTDNNRVCNIIDPNSIRAKNRYFGCRA